MCQVGEEIFRIEDDLTVYKVVRKTAFEDKWLSEFEPIERSMWSRRGIEETAWPGEEITYKRNEMAESDIDNTPGIMVFLNKSNALACCTGLDTKVAIEGTVPRGARARFGSEFDKAYLGVSTFVPKRVVENET